MPERNAASDCPVAALRNRTAANILCDERTIAALARLAAVLREEGDPFVPEIEHAIRTHRIGIIKQRAILGAVGIAV